MAQLTKIQWCHHTFNPWIGCQKVHEGCTHCYAEHLADARFGWARWGLRGTRRRTSPTNWRAPMKWERQAGRAKKRRRVFCASLADVFEARPELHSWRVDLFALIDQTPWLDWLLLSKRPENVASMWPDPRYRPNIWLGTSISNQKTADEWVPRLVANRERCPVLFLSVEPLLAPIHNLPLDNIDWLIVGGESGHQARPCQDEWIRSIIDQARAADVAVFVKQLGKRDGLRDKKGGDPAEWPKDLRIREFPRSSHRTSAAGRTASVSRSS